MIREKTLLWHNHSFYAKKDLKGDFKDKCVSASTFFLFSPLLITQAYAGQKKTLTTELSVSLIVPLYNVLNDCGKISFG